MVHFNVVEFLSTSTVIMIGGVFLKLIDKLCQRYCPPEVVEVEERVRDTISEAVSPAHLSEHNSPVRRGNSRRSTDSQ